MFLIAKWRKLDFISGWIYKGAEFITGTTSQLGFVSTNSVCQGEQVSILWPNLLRLSKIKYAYSSFKWGNNAKNNAGVTVVIIGLMATENVTEKKLFIGNSYRTVENITPYLTDSDNDVIVYKSKKSLFKLPVMYRGNMPTDGGGLIINEDDLGKIPSDLTPYIHKFIGSKDSLNGTTRYVMWLNENDYNNVKDNSFVKERLEIVKNMRLKSKKKSTNKLACVPWKFEFISQPLKNKGNTILVPRVSSQTRLYMPISVVNPEDIVSDTATAIYNAPLFLFGLLESRMHMIWLRSIGGKLETRYRYSSDLVYNTFPVPELSTRRKNEIEDLVLNILDIRDEEGGTLAELYGSPLAEKNPKPMNPRLLEAHQALDEVVDRAYKPSGFNDDNERLSLLLKMYSEKVKEQKK